MYLSNTTPYLYIKIATFCSLKTIIRPPLQYFECKAKYRAIVSTLWDPTCFTIIFTIQNCIKLSKIGCDLASDCKLTIIKFCIGKVKIPSKKGKVIPLQARCGPEGG